MQSVRVSKYNLAPFWIVSIEQYSQVICVIPLDFVVKTDIYLIPNPMILAEHKREVLNVFKIVLLSMGRIPVVTWCLWP